jgi:hypothetical protein
VQYLHIKNLEKYHPKYADRKLVWCKTYFTMLNSDPEFELLTEVDKWRFVAFVMLELQLQAEIPLDPAYLFRKGFDLKKRPISLTLQMLHNFIVVREKPSQNRAVDKEEDKDIREKRGVTEKTVTPPLTDQDFINSLKTNPAYKHIDFETELGRADGWLLAHPGRKKTRQFIVRWLNRIEKPMAIKTSVVKVDPRPAPIDPVERAKVSALIHETVGKMKGRGE